MEHVDDVTSIFGGHVYPSPTNGIPTDVTDESFYSAYLKLIQATATRVRPVIACGARQHATRAPSHGQLQRPGQRTTPQPRA